MRWGSKGSLSLVIAGPKAGCWFDHEIGRGGDVLEFIKIERGCDFIDALDYASQFVAGLRRAPAPKPAAQQIDDGDDERRIEEALTIWCESQPLRGTLAETYLQSRCIEVPDEALAVLRFHPRCPWRGMAGPALVALIRDNLTDEPTGIHRTLLSNDARKLGRAVLGPKADGAIKLAAPTSGLAIAEGIETALSATAMGFGPAWSVIDAGEMTKFPALPWIEELTVLADNDIGGTGLKAASAVWARWQAAGLRVRIEMPPMPGQDFNDVLRGRS